MTVMISSKFLIVHWTGRVFRVTPS